MAIITDYQPWYTTQTYPSLSIPLLVSGSADNITGIAANSFVMTFRTAAGSDTIGTGTFSIITFNPAVVSYTFSTADVSAAFAGALIISTTFPQGGNAVYDPIAFTVTVK